MLGDFIYSEEVKSATRTAVTPQKIERTVKRLLLLFLIFICAGLLWILAIRPCMAPVKTYVQSFPGLSAHDALAIAGIHSRSTYISVNIQEVEHMLSRHYSVESARVVKRFPDRVYIFLEQRKPVAVAFARINNRTQPVYIDRHGVVSRIGASGVGEAPPLWLPVVSGVLDNYPPPRLGMSLPALFLPLFSRIAAISDENPDIWRAISEIGVYRKSNYLYDLILYPVHDPIRLRMGSDITKDSIYYALLMFDVSRQFGSSMPHEIDVRSGIGVFRN
jgi:cell division protein FtsQ